MSYKVAPLTVNPKQKSSLSSKVFVSQPSAEEELLVGRLFVLMEIDSSRVDDFAVADFIVKDMYRHYYENEQFFLRDKIANLKIDYIFEAALTKLNRGIAEFLEQEKIKLRSDALTIVIGVLHKNRLLFAHTGSSKAMLIYRPKTKAGVPLDYQLLDISEKTEDPTQELANPTKLFANVVNGQIPSQGYFLFTNQSVLEYLSKKQLTDVVTTLPPAGAAEQLRGLLEQTDAFVPFFALIVKNTTGEEPLPSMATPAVAIEIPQTQGLGHSSINRLNTTQEKTEQLLSPSGFTTIKKWMAKLQPASAGITTYARNKAQKLNLGNRLGSASQRLDVGRKVFDVLRVSGALIVDGAVAFYKLLSDPAVRSSALSSLKNGLRGIVISSGRLIDRLKTLSRRQKILLGVIAVCLLAFGGNLIYSSITARQRAADAALTQAQTTFEQKEHQLEASLLYNNTDGARGYLNDMDAIIKGIARRNDKEKAVAVDLEKRYHARLDTLYNVSRLENPAAFAELPATGDSLTLAGDGLYTVNGASKSVYVIANDRSIATLSVNDLNGKSVTALADEDDAYFWDGDSLLSYDPATKFFKKASIENPTSSASIAIYNTRLYAASTTDKAIYRYNQDHKTVSFSNRMNWLRAPLDGAAVSSVSVNGKLYLIADNQVRAFSGGNMSALVLDPTVPALEVPTQVIASADQKTLYVLETKNKRVILYSAEGKYNAQYTSEAFNDLKGMALDEEAKQLYVLNGNKIYQVALK